MVENRRHLFSYVLHGTVLRTDVSTKWEQPITEIKGYMTLMTMVKDQAFSASRLGAVLLGRK